VSASASFLGVLVCLALSGFAGLLYQTAWTREFAFVFGTSEIAVAVVLAGYMAGLAAGAALAGRLVGYARRPLLLYGVLEAGIALGALAAPYAIHGILDLSVSLFGGLPEPPGAESFGRAAFQLGASLAILFVPTALMGATLPLLARYCVHEEQQIGSRIGTLYAVNTLGAVGGAVATAFFLLPALGLRQTVWLGAAINLAVFLLAALIARATPATIDAPTAEERTAAPPTSPSGPRAILALMMVGGFASFAYEVLWTRLLGQLLGGTVYAFATMLASFLAGIAIGSAIAAPLARTRRGAVTGFVVTEIGLALAARAAFLGLDRLPEVAATMGGGAGYHPVRDALMSAFVLLPSTLFLGATFPFAVRIFARDADDAAPASARVYAWNTVGGVAGALAGGLWLMPGLGFANTMLGLSVTNAVIALVACFLVAPPRRLLAGAATAAAVGLALAPIDEPWRLLRVMALGGQVVDDDLAFFKVGRSSTVMLTVSPEGWGLRTNGLPESTIQRVEREDGLVGARWLSGLPVLINPAARSMLVVGFGGGVIVESVPNVIETIDVVELEPVVVEANAFVAGRRVIDPLADPRVRIHINDVRGALALTSKKWDIVASQPSHPWTPGASHLYTYEFAKLVREHLNPGGVFLQWIGMPFVDRELFLGLVAAARDAFEHVAVYEVSGSFLILGSDEPPLVGADAQTAIDADPVAFARAGVVASEDGWVQQRLDESEIERLIAGVARSTDEHNLMLTRSPQILGHGNGDKDWGEFLKDRDAIVNAAPEGLDLLYAVRRLVLSRNPDRARLIADRIEDPVEQLVARGYIEAARGDARWAAETFRAALARKPDAHEAAAALALSALASGARLGPLAEAGLAASGRLVVRASRLAAQGDVAGLRAMDAELGALAVRDPMFAAAATLRGRWRVETGEVRLAGEAFDILRRAQILSDRPAAAQLLRARAAEVLGQPEQAQVDLRAALRSAGVTGGLSERDLVDARILLDRLPLAPRGSIRQGLLQNLDRLTSPRMFRGGPPTQRNAP
jgi:spermidine synthase